jgi:hypothetical protein
MPNIIKKRLAKIATIPLLHGGHDDGSASNAPAMCVMEAVAWIAGEKWSASPKCVSPMIASFLRSWNDGLPTDADRDRLLKPLIPKLIGTAGTKKYEERRGWMVLDWSIRQCTPAFLRLVKLDSHADALKAIPEIVSFEGLEIAMRALLAAKLDATAGLAAARAAAWAATRDATRAAGLAAAWDAARDAAKNKFAPIVAGLQMSAVALIERMIEVGKAV